MVLPRVGEEIRGSLDRLEWKWGISVGGSVCLDLLRGPKPEPIIPRILCRLLFSGLSHAQFQSVCKERHTAPLIRAASKRYRMSVPLWTKRLRGTKSSNSYAIGKKNISFKIEQMNSLFSLFHFLYLPSFNFGLGGRQTQRPI